MFERFESGTLTVTSEIVSAECKTYKDIPIRNLWVLLLYASKLFPEVEKQRAKQGREETPDDILEIIAEMLLVFVRERLMRGLTRASLLQKADLSRVRGSIEHLRTERRQLLARGLVACRFSEPTLNTARNKLIKAALLKGAKVVKDGKIRKDCHDYATILFRMGVVGSLPDRETLSKEVYGINDKEDRYAVAAARLLLDNFMPCEQAGTHSFFSLNATEQWLRKLFEAGVRGLYRVAAPQEWQVAKGNVRQNWPSEIPENMKEHLPQMELDILLTNRAESKKIVIDTKFTKLFQKSKYREASLKSNHIYQIYTYLRTQEEQGKNDVERRMNRQATGVLLYPAVEKEERLEVTIQGHRLLFVTVNLGASPKEIRRELLDILEY